MKTKRTNTQGIPCLIGKGNVVDDTLVVKFPNNKLFHTHYSGIAVVQVIGLFSAFHVKEVQLVMGNQRKSLMWHGRNANGENVPYAGFYVVYMDNESGLVSLA